ncbi:MAG: hypothetical protein IT289_07960 [Oligoflexia bacterium]|nr:hypothetical protein [Oligoflexia bacterium]
MSKGIQVKGPQALSSTLYVEREGKTYKLKSDIYILSPKAIRIDVTSTVDLPLASVVLTDAKIEYVMYRAKKHYFGKPNPKALDPVFPLSVDVQSLWSVLNEKPTAGSECEGATSQPAKCSGESEGIRYTVEWAKRSSAGPWAGRATKISLSFPDRAVSLKFYLTGWQKNLSDSDGRMALQVPQGFQSFPVPEM